MNITNALMAKVGDIFLASKRRRDAEYADFLAFYRTLVEETDSAVAKAIGNISVAVTEDGCPRNWNILLTAADYIWWKQKITEAGVLFSTSIEQVKADILMSLAAKAESNGLTAAERKSLIALLDQSGQV